MKTVVVALMAVLLNVNLSAQSSLEKAALDGKMVARAQELKEVLQTDKGYRSAVYIYQRRTVKDYHNRPEELAARLSLLGFTDVYLGASRAILLGEDSEDEVWIRRFNAAVHQYGIKTYFLTLSSSKLWVDDSRIYEDIKNYIDYNYAQKKGERFDGISVDLEPHIMKKAHPERPKELTWEWDGKDGYGKGRDNDLLCKRMVEVLGKARKELGRGICMSQAQGFFLQGRYDKGELEWGSAQQLIKPCDWIIVMAYNFKPERVFEMARPSLVSAKEKPRSVSIAIKTSLDTYGSEGPVTSFQPQGWDYLIQGIRLLMREGSGYPSFRGIDVFEFQGFEMMWNGTAVENKSTLYEKSSH